MVRWYQRFKRTGNVAPDLPGGDRQRQKPMLLWFCSGLTGKQPLTIREICGRLCQQGHKLFLAQGIWRLIKRHNYTVKKDDSCERHEDVKVRRQLWFDDPQPVMADLYLRHKHQNVVPNQGEHCVASIPHGHWKTVTLVVG